MKKEWTEQDLQGFAEAARTVFEDVSLTRLPDKPEPYWQDEGMQVDYELRGGQVNCVLHRCLLSGGQLWQLRMTAPLAGNTLPEDRMTARERELCRDDMNHDFLSGAFNRRYLETVFCTQLDVWSDEHRCAAVALVELNDYDNQLCKQGQRVMEQLLCFIANQWKKHYDHANDRVVCRLSDRLIMVGCVDRTARQLAEEMRALYAEMPHECIASVGAMRRVPFALSIACASTDEVRGKNWEALYNLCGERLHRAQAAGTDGVFWEN